MSEPTETAQLFARVFRGEDGQRALDHLRRQSVDRPTRPDISNRELRFLEGQRALVLHIETLVKNGRQS